MPSPSESPSSETRRSELGVRSSFEPRIIAFLCNWCTYAGADLAGTSRMQYPPNTRTIRVMCSGAVDPTLVLEAFRDGADAVLIGGCHPGDCHYQNGNYKTRARVYRANPGPRSAARSRYRQFRPLIASQLPTSFISELRHMTSDVFSFVSDRS